MSDAAVPFGDAARRADAELFDVDRRIDWLARLSPLDNERRWQAFRDGGYVASPPLTYRPLDIDTGALRERLENVSTEEIEQPSLRALLLEKRTELLQFVTLLETRDTVAFTAASVTLFGGTDPSLLSEAREILETVPPEEEGGAMADAADLAAEAQAAREAYRRIDPTLDFRIECVDDLDAGLVVHQGHLKIDSRLAIPAARVPALVAHEVGVHVLTRHNGRRQPLRLFESGFAGYDVLQEGLATLAEYLAGCLPPSRLRALAARVVAADLVVRQEPLEGVFAALHEGHGMDARAAFDVAVRARRGGGLTKDAVYLAGLRDLLAWLREGGDVEPLFLGKYALHQRHLVADLLDEGFLVPPALLPSCYRGSAARERLERAASTPLSAFHSTEHSR